MKKIVIGSLLVGGTAIGAGMLALPIATASGGLFPAWIVYCLCWLFSMCTGLLFIEIALWLAPGANIVTMAHKLLGPGGRMAAWLLYIFLFYSLTIAYIAGGGNLLANFLGLSAANPWLTFLFVLLFGTFVYFGTKAVGTFNSVMMIGLVLAYIGFVIFGFENVRLEPFEKMDFSMAFLALPIIFTSFSYQGVIPSLLEYMDRDPRKMKLSVIIGSTIPFVCYILWDFLIKSIIPVEGAHGLVEAGKMGMTAVDPLSYYVPGSAILVLGKCFAFFALTTSFLGVTLGLLDFLADSLKIKKKKWNRFGLCVLIYVPPFIIATINPTIFLKALGYAGGFGCAILLGLLPIMMVWSGRYGKEKEMLPGRLFGGRILLSLLGLFVLFEIALEVVKEIFS